MEISQAQCVTRMQECKSKELKEKQLIKIRHVQFWCENVTSCVHKKDVFQMSLDLYDKFAQKLNFEFPLEQMVNEAMDIERRSQNSRANVRSRVQILISSTCQRASNMIEDTDRCRMDENPATVCSDDVRSPNPVLMQVRSV